MARSRLPGERHFDPRAAAGDDEGLLAVQRLGDQPADEPASLLGVHRGQPRTEPHRVRKRRGVERAGLGWCHPEGCDGDVDERQLRAARRRRTSVPGRSNTADDGRRTARRGRRSARSGSNTRRRPHAREQGRSGADADDCPQEPPADDARPPWQELGQASDHP
ncbi:MAG: hypothetical protein ACLP01_11360 [Solirubrobacteraceae bacterium]